MTLPNFKARFRRARPGSVLILVVALLVLLALIGTAYLSSTQAERYTSGQNSINTQADLYLQGLENSVTSAVSGSLFGSGSNFAGQFRPPTQTGKDTSGNAVNTGYINYTSTSANLWLGDRLPLIDTNINRFAWKNVSLPLFTDSSGYYTFDSPFSNSASIYLGSNKSSVEYLPSAMAVNGQVYPSMSLYVPGGSLVIDSAGNKAPGSGNFLTPGGMSTSEIPVYAGSASGDGIADSLFFKLPGGPVNGITYYGAVRIIDGNSAVNVNTALSNACDYSVTPAGSPTVVDALGTAATVTTATSTSSTGNKTTGYVSTFGSPNSAPLGFFPSHVGLMQLALDYNPTAQNSTEVENVLRYLSQEASTALDPLADGTLKWDQALPDSTPTTKRPDFTFLTVGDHLNSQVARRISWPGYFVGSGGDVQHATFGVYDATALASRYSIRSGSLSRSNLETQMPATLVNGTQTTPYGPTQWANWYYAITQGSRRAMLVTSNGVSDYIPAHSITDTTGVVGPINPDMLPYNPAVYSNTGTYAPGAFVKFQDTSTSPAQPYRCYMALKTISATPPVSGIGVPDITDWRLEEAWTDTPAKASINTADFATLWRAFYNIFADAADTVPPRPGTTDRIAYDAKALAWGPFRNPVRAASIVAANTILPGQVLQLRAGIAAVSAMDMRDTDDDITSRRITLYSDAQHTVPQYTATVFGLEKQPFISTVVADYDGTNPTQLSIELYNPTDTDIDISNWQLATVNHTSTGGLMTVSPAVAGGAPIPAGTKIPAGGYYIIRSSSASNLNPASTPTLELYTEIPNLQAVADPSTNLDLVILRPRRADNTYTSSTVYGNEYNEGSIAAPRLDQLVPVDSIDFTDVFVKGQPNRRVYERPHGQTGTANYNWMFVYPGKYDAFAGSSPTGGSAGTNLTSTPAQAGWGAMEPSTALASQGGTASDGTTAGGNNKNNAHAIQLATSNWISPNPAISATGNKYPLGAFPRNGDMLKIPFMGAYVIRPYTTTPSTTSQVVEINSISMDATRVTAAQAIGTEAVLESTSINTSVTQDEAEGRFCPLVALYPTTTTYKSDSTHFNVDPYGWAAHFFDYLDVQVSSDDFMPNVDPRLADGSMPSSGNGASATNVLKYTGAKNSSLTGTLPPEAVPNVTKNSTNGNPEAGLGKQGLININTAPANVLDLLPGITPDMADAIVADRVANGPFKSIFDLNRVGAASASVLPGITSFQTDGGQIKFQKAATPPTKPPIPDNDLADDPGIGLGDFTPGKAGANDGVRGDFEERTLMLTRMSNLITTRSDTFTCYILLEGWRNAGTATPTLVVQRRAAFILDRNNVTPSNNTPASFKVPTE